MSENKLPLRVTLANLAHKSIVSGIIIFTSGVIIVDGFLAFDFHKKNQKIRV